MLAVCRNSCKPTNEHLRTFCCFLQARIATADRRAADLDSQLLLLGRALREAEGGALEWQSKARQAEQARQDLGNMVAGSEKAVQQVSRALSCCLLPLSSQLVAALLATLTVLQFVWHPITLITKAVYSDSLYGVTSTGMGTRK